MKTGQVFVSRTSDMAHFPAGRSFIDAVLGAVNRAGMAPVDMRYFAARGGAPAEYCRQRVRECEVYVAVVGFRYGSMVPGEQVSYTELEFNEATAAGLPRLGFLLSRTASVPVGLADADRRAVKRFRQRLLDAGLLVREFTTPEGLELEAFHALSDLPGARPAIPAEGAVTSSLPPDTAAFTGRGAVLTLAGIADQLAEAVNAQWEAEAGVRRLNDPYPLPVSWEAADASLADGWDVLVRHASSGAGMPPPPPPGTWADSPELLAGTGGGLVRVLAQVPTGRLVVLGKPGSGKTMLMVRLVLDLLEARKATGGPVPVLAALASWNPAEQDLHDWLTGQLIVDHPALAAPAPSGAGAGNRVQALLRACLILPVLDGLDEMPDAIRGQ